MGDVNPEASGRDDSELSEQELAELFRTGEPVELVRPNNRSLVVRYRYSGGHWQASSPDIPSFLASAATLAQLRKSTRELLGNYVDSDVELIEYQVGNARTVAAGVATIVRGPVVRPVSTGGSDAAVTSPARLVSA